MKLSTKITSTLLLALAVLAVSTPAFAAEPAGGVININKADPSQLVYLPRIGPALAGRIVEFREENGDFKKADDLMLVKGIGEKTYELMAPFVRVSGETTLKAKVSVARPPGAKESAPKEAAEKVATEQVEPQSQG